MEFRVLIDECLEREGRMIGEDGTEPAVLTVTRIGGPGEAFTVGDGLSGSFGGFRVAYCHSILSTVAGLAREEADTSSYDSERLTESASTDEPLRSRSMGKVAMKFETEPLGVLVSVSEDSETE